MDYVKAFNGFRGIAFIYVLFDHYIGGYISLGIGQFGVGMFFILSGYLLTAQLYKQYVEKNSMNIINYFIRRLFRIYPCLTLALLCEFLLSRYTFFQILSIFFLVDSRKHYWTIYVEMRYYVIVPFIVLLFAHLKNFVVKFSVMLVITALGFFYHYYLNFIVGLKTIKLCKDMSGEIEGNILEKNMIFINYLPIFLLGSFMSIIVYHLKKINYDFNSHSTLKGIFILFISLIHIPIIYFGHVNRRDTVWGPVYENSSIIYCSGYVFALMFMNGNNIMTSFYQSKLVSFFGDISYPGYLFHMIVLELTFKYWQWKYTNVFHIFICFLISVSLSYLLHISVETYCINWTKNWCFVSKDDKDASQDTYVQVALQDTDAPITDEELTSKGADHNNTMNCPITSINLQNPY